MPERPRPMRIVADASVEARPFLAVEAAASGKDPVAEALDRGRAEGRHEAEAAHETALAALRAEFAASLRSLAALQETLTNRHETLLVELAVEAASRIVRERIEAGDGAAARAVREGIEGLPRSAAIRVRAHPGDVSALETELRLEIDRGKIEIVADPGVSRGGSILESPVGTVDATLEAATDAVRAAALGEAEGA